MQDFLEKHAPPVLITIILYFIGSFIAWDLNPAHWTLVTTVTGRVAAVLLGMGYIKAILDHYSEF